MTEQATWTAEADARLRAYLARDGYIIPVGLGSEDAACSMAAINLALTGVLSGDIPVCMSTVVGKWLINVQDNMPAGLRNSAEWRELLPLAAGTGRACEQERLDLILDWMWGTALPIMQPLADTKGLGALWRAMCEKQSYASAIAARDASFVSDGDAAYVCCLVVLAQEATEDEKEAVCATAAAIAVEDDCGSGGDSVWERLDPVGLLRRLVEVGHG